MTDASVQDSDTDTQLHVETLWPVGRELGIDRGDETGKKLVCRLRVRHRQHHGVAGLLPQSAPVHQKRRLADRPLAQQSGVLRLTFARASDARLKDRRLALTPSQQRREDPFCPVGMGSSNVYVNNGCKLRSGRLLALNLPL